MFYVFQVSSSNASTHIFKLKFLSHFTRSPIPLSLNHEFTLEHKRLSCPARIHFFANRIVNNWNSLPNHVVNAGSLNIFKNSLDRLWAKQDLLYSNR